MILKIIVEMLGLQDKNVHLLKLFQKASETSRRNVTQLKLGINWEKSKNIWKRNTFSTFLHSYIF